ncbi:MAG: hypothetical protein M3Z66_20525 [Chloroflexota bacterium]|nr:hypothetical protein [Chloroflexota bacterium]
MCTSCERAIECGAEGSCPDCGIGCVACDCGRYCQSHDDPVYRDTADHVIGGSLCVLREVTP